MKKSIFILIICLITISAQAKELYLSVKIQNPISDQISFKIVSDALKGEKKLYVLTLDSQNEVYSLLSFDEVEMITANYNDQLFDIYVKGIDKIDLSFTGNNLIKSLQFKGEGAVENNLLNDFRKKYHWNQTTTIFRKGLLDCHISNYIIKSAKAETPERYFQQLLSRVKEQQNFLSENNTKINAGFYTFLEQETIIKAFTNKAAYFIVKQDELSKIQIKRYIEANQVFQSFLENDDLLHHPSYINASIAFTYLKYLQSNSEEYRESFAFYDLIEKSFKQKTKHWLLTKLFLVAHGEDYRTLAKEKFSDFKRSNPPLEYIKLVETTYGNLSTSNDLNEVAPIFELPDEDGNIISLKKYKGQVIYISFWATWCKPCLASFMKTERIRLAMQDRGVVLLNVSLDQDDFTWRNTMARVPMPGVNLFGGESKNLHLLYDLSKLPSYFIIGKDGKFAYLSDSPGRNILDEFDKLLGR